MNTTAMWITQFAMDAEGRCKWENPSHSILSVVAIAAWLTRQALHPGLSHGRQAAFGKGPVPVGELVAAGLGGARSRAIAFKAIADGLPPQYRLRTRLVRAPYPQVVHA